MTEHVLDELDAYALGALDRAEAERVAQHLSTCASCRNEAAALAEVVGALPDTVALHDPRPALRERLLEAARTEARSPVRDAAAGPTSAAPRGLPRDAARRRGSSLPRHFRNSRRWTRRRPDGWRRCDRALPGRQRSHPRRPPRRRCHPRLTGNHGPANKFGSRSRDKRVHYRAAAQKNLPTCNLTVTPAILLLTCSCKYGIVLNVK